MKALHMVAYILVWIGGINWGIMGIGMLSGAEMNDWNVVTMILGSWPTLEALVYVLVGVSAVFLIATHKSYCKNCMGESTGGMM